MCKFTLIVLIFNCVLFISRKLFNNKPVAIIAGAPQYAAKGNQIHLLLRLLLLCFILDKIKTMTTSSNSVAVEGGERDENEGGSTVLVETGTLECRAPLKEQQQQQQERERELENVQPQAAETFTETISQYALQQQHPHEMSLSMTPPLPRKRHRLQEEADALLQEVFVKLARGQEQQKQNSPHPQQQQQAPAALEQLKHLIDGILLDNTSGMKEERQQNVEAIAEKNKSSSLDAVVEKGNLAAMRGVKLFNSQALRI